MFVLLASSDSKYMCIFFGRNIVPPWPFTVPLIGDHHTWTVVPLLISQISE